MELAYRILAAVPTITCGPGGGTAINLPNCGKDVTDANSVATAVQISSEIAGAVCLLIMVLAGLRYVVSAGNPESISRAKNEIIYAAVGLVVCLSAYIIVTFVIGKL